MHKSCCAEQELGPFLSSAIVRLTLLNFKDCHNNLFLVADDDSIKSLQYVLTFFFVILQAGSVSDAFQTFKELQSLDKNTAGSAAVIGQLAAAAVKSDPKTAQSLGEYLRPITSISADKVEELEATGKLLFVRILRTCLSVYLTENTLD